MAAILEKKETNYEQSKNKSHCPCTLSMRILYMTVCQEPHTLNVCMWAFCMALCEGNLTTLYMCTCVHAYMSTVYVCTWQTPPPLHVSTMYISTVYISTVYVTVCDEPHHPLYMSTMYIISTMYVFIWLYVMNSTTPACEYFICKYCLHNCTWQTPHHPCTLESCT